YPKQTLWLRLDLPHLRETRADAVADTTWVVRKRFGEPPILLPPHERYIERVDRERRQCMQDNLDWLGANPVALERIVLHHRHYRYPFIPDLDADAGLYQNGFFSRADEALCRDFHAAELPGKIAIAEHFAGREARLLAARLLFRNFASDLPERWRHESDTFYEGIQRGEPALDFTGTPRRSARAGLQELGELRSAAGLDADQLGRLEEMEGFIRQHFNAVAGEER
ncbi:MAG: hypothetical protein MUC33_24020, partial [Desulfobacterales bacterium]|nr:hypothetical protein [Desulfobacterales bacterium]